MAKSAAPVLLWDREGEPRADGPSALRWRSFAGDSIPAYLEANAERLRAKYLGFVHDLGQAEVAGRRVVEHLAWDGELSFWWMTWVAEKSPFKSPAVYSSLRLLALEEMLRARAPARVELDSGDADLAAAVSALCRSLGIVFTRRPGARAARPWRRLVPAPLKGLFALARFLVTRWPLRRGAKPGGPAGRGAVFICSFFAHLDAAACARGEFRSRYWDSLPEKLRDGGQGVYWLHQFVHGYSSDAPDARTTLRWLELFNADGGRQGAHAFLESSLSPAVAFRAFKDWLGLCRASLRLRGIEGAFFPRGSAAWLWPFHRDDWRFSTTGPAGALNCLWAELFDAALADVPKQRIGLYLYEGQGWEMAFLRAWRKHGHGKAVGVAHSTVPFWHLYDFDDPRSFDPGRTFPRPRPDRLAVNGPAAVRVFAGVGRPPAPLVEVEALRYLALPRARRPAAAGVRVLVLGDVLPESMRSLLSSLEGAMGLLPEFRFTLKPHPLHPVDLSGYPGLRIERTTTEGLDRILDDFDVAIAANSTSACVDAHLAGLPVIVGLNGADLNLSPLRGEPGVRFFGTTAELADALRAAGRAPAAEFFHLDPDLPRWRRLLRMDVEN